MFERHGTSPEGEDVIVHSKAADRTPTLLMTIKGRDAREACLGLIKTCQKQGLTFFDYLGARLGVPDASLIPPLPDLVRARASS